MGDRILLDSGEFVNPHTAAQRQADFDPEELLQLKSDLAQLDREKKGTSAQLERVEKEYRDLKQAYDTVLKELTEFRKVSLANKESKAKK